MRDTDGSSAERGPPVHRAPGGVMIRRSRRRAQITDRAARIFQRHGYASTPMQEVADAVGLSKASLYYYVTSKDDLLFQILEEVHLAGETIVAEVETLDVPPLERLAAYLRRWVQFNVDHLAKTAVFNRELDRLDPARRRMLQAGRARRFAFVVELVHEAQTSGGVDAAVDAEAVAHTTQGMVSHMHTWYRPGRGAGAAELGDLIAAMVSGLGDTAD